MGSDQKGILQPATPVRGGIAVTCALVALIVFAAELVLLRLLPTLIGWPNEGAEPWGDSLFDAALVALIAGPCGAAVVLWRHPRLGAPNGGIGGERSDQGEVGGRFKPWMHGVGAAALVIALGAAALSASWVLGGRALKASLDEELSTIAVLAAQRVDADAHAGLTDASQHGGALYERVVAPLREMREKTPSIKYLYTMRNSPEGPVFIVDAAEPGDHDGDGVEDQSLLGEVYEDADADTLRAVAGGSAIVSAQPYADKWGTFISAFAPVHRGDGTLECVVGVDMTAGAYMERRSMMSRAVLFGGLLIVLGAAGIGTMVTLMEAARRASEREVRSSAMRKEKIASQVPGMIYQFRLGPDKSVSFPYASRKMLDLFGVEPGAARDNGSAVFATIHPDDLPGLMESIEVSAATLMPWRFQFRARAHGTTGYRWLEGNSTPEQEPGGSTLWHGFVTDVSEAKLEEALREEQLTLAAALSAASEVPEAARALNDSLGRTTGLPRTAVLLYDRRGVCRFVGWRGLSEEYRAAAQGHCPWKHGEAAAEPIVVQDVTKDGTLAAFASLFAREGVRSLAFVPIMTNAGVAGKLMLYGSTPGEMTRERLRAARMAAGSLGLAVGRLMSREALARGEERVRTVIDTALDAVVAMNAEGTVTEWNCQAERTFGWTRSEAVGRPMHELIIPEDPPHLRQMHVAGLKRYLVSGEMKVLGRRIEVPAVTKGGHVITVELAITGVKSGEEVTFSAFLRDVTAKKRAESALRESERITRLLAEHTSDLVGLSTVDEHPLYASPSVQRTLGYSPEAWARGACRDHVHQEDRAAMDAAAAANARGEATTRRYRATTADGGTVWLEKTVTPVLAEGTTTVEHVVWSSRDVTAQVQSEHALESMALTDRLTGLPNSALLHDRVEGVMARAARDKGRHYAVMFLDFDRFKLVNDTLGHEAGDELLRQIAERMRATLRATDTLSRAAHGHTLSRMGGDEFVIVLDELASPQDVRVVADRLLSVLAAPYTIAGQTVTSTASIGVVLGDPRYTRPDELLRDADTAMYEAKAAGRGRWVMFDEAMRSKLVRRAELERDLAGACARGEITVFYQPVVSLETRAWVGMEALARWTHPRLGPVSPAEFIPIAEESDLISEIGAWVFERACRDLKGWRQSGVLPQGVTVAVNLSRRQLTSSGVSERLGTITRAAGLTPRDLCIEITETAVMRDKEAGIRMLCALRDQGFKLSLDDFGTGHSSLASLREFPIDAVKIDRSFIACVSEGLHNAAMMHALADLSRNIGMSIVAEGVETADQVALLQAIGCGNAQGYFFGRPMPADQVPAAAQKAREWRDAA